MDYKKNDFGFDLEIRGNFFVNSQVYPKQKKIIVSFLEELTEIEDQDLEQTNEKIETLIQSVAQNQISGDILSDQDTSRLTKTLVNETLEVKENKEKNWKKGFLQKYYVESSNDYKVENIKERLDLVSQSIKDVVHRVKDYEIIYENLAIYEDFISFAKRYGFHKKSIKNKELLGDFAVIADTDPTYDPEIHGYALGYNSLSYDQTFLANLLGETMEFIIRLESSGSEKNKIQARELFFDKVINQTSGSTNPLSPEDLVIFNNKMFENQKQMNSTLGRPWDDKISIDTYNSWKNSNRFVDVMSLNPKRIALKRAALNLGYKIQESSNNSNPTARLTTLQEVIDLISYNVNDIIAEFVVFETKSYQNRFNQNLQLLSEFPYLVYDQSKQGADPKSKKKIDPVIDPNHVRKDRLTVNSTSTKLTTNVIAPYLNTKILDNPTLTLTYPSPHMAEKLHKEGKLPPLFEGKAMNVLDYLQKLINKNFKPNCKPEVFDQIQSNFNRICKFYNSFVGKNFNDELVVGENTDQPFTDPTELERELVIKYITNSGSYKSKYGELLISIVKMSIGGIHGVEILWELYEEDLYAYEHAQKSIEDLLTYHQTHDDPSLTMEKLPAFITQLMPEKPFAHVKKMKLPNNEHFTYGDIINSTASRKKPKDAKFKLFKEPSVFDKNGKVNKRYSYTSTGQCGHEDFDSYYPAIISLLEIFLNADGEDIFTSGLFHPRLKVKKQAREKWRPESERILLDLRQNSLKLCINAASGGGDSSFITNIKCNNKMMAMRIIGQLFCWYIGQSLSIYDARIPSSNTDGLYSMNIGIEENKKIVKRCSEEIMLSIEAEELDLFVSKDSNNRLEVKKGEITSARGSALTSWEGPSTDAAIDHPAIVDWVLAHYLAFTHDACDRIFDPNEAKKHFYTFMNNPDMIIADKLRFLQFPVISSEASMKFAFLSNLDNPDDFEILNHTNRVFLVKREYSNKAIKFAGVGAVKPETIIKRFKDGLISSKEYIGDIITIDPIANAVIKQSTSKRNYDKLFNQPFNPKTTDVKEKPRDIKIIKIKEMPLDQPVLLNNEDLYEVTQDEYDAFIKKLDFNALLDMVESKFKKQWQNNNASLLEKKETIESKLTVKS